MLAVRGSPFGVASTGDGRWSFVDETTGAVAVFADASDPPRLLRTIAVPGEAVGNSLADGGRLLLVAGVGPDAQEASVLSVAAATSGAGNAELGVLRSPHPLGGGGPIEVSGTPDGAYAFVSVEYGDRVDVFNLRAALRGGFKRSTYVGSISLGDAVVGQALSPDGRWLYVTSELAGSLRAVLRHGGPGALKKTPGTLSVISVAKAEAGERQAVAATVHAGCQPARVAVAPGGATVWVTARASDDLLAFSASQLISHPAHALLASVRVGEAPVGLAFVNAGRWIAVADSNRFGARGAHSEITLVDAAAALAHRPAVLGTIRAGSFPREMSLEGNGRILLVGNWGSGQLETIELPGRSTTG